MPEIEGLRDDIAGLRADVQALTAAQLALTSSQAALTQDARRRQLVTRVLTALVTVCLALLVIGVANVRYTTNQATCVRDWANAYAARTNALVPAATAKNNASDAWFRTLALPEGERQAKFQAAFVLYLKASDRYTQIADQNPPPTAPQYTC
jgi:hypothetical protein